MLRPHNNAHHSAEIRVCVVRWSHAIHARQQSFLSTPPGHTKKYFSAAFAVGKALEEFSSSPVNSPKRSKSSGAGITRFLLLGGDRLDKLLKLLAFINFSRRKESCSVKKFPFCTFSTVLSFASIIFFLLNGGVTKWGITLGSKTDPPPTSRRYPFPFRIVVSDLRILVEGPRFG